MSLPSFIDCLLTYRRRQQAEAGKATAVPTNDTLIIHSQTQVVQETAKP